MIAPAVTLNSAILDSAILSFQPFACHYTSCCCLYEVVTFLFLGRVHRGHWVRVRTGKSCLCCYRALSFNHFDTASASPK
jgi:hypothetical protein